MAWAHLSGTSATTKSVAGQLSARKAPVCMRPADWLVAWRLCSIAAGLLRLTSWGEVVVSRERCGEEGGLSCMLRMTADRRFCRWLGRGPDVRRLQQHHAGQGCLLAWGPVWGAVALVCSSWCRRPVSRCFLQLLGCASCWLGCLEHEGMSLPLTANPTN